MSKSAGQNSLAHESKICTTCAPESAWYFTYVITESVMESSSAW